MLLKCGILLKLTEEYFTRFLSSKISTIFDREPFMYIFIGKKFLAFNKEYHCANMLQHLIHSL